MNAKFLCVQFGDNDFGLYVTNALARLWSMIEKIIIVASINLIMNIFLQERWL